MMNKEKIVKELKYQNQSGTIELTVALLFIITPIILNYIFVKADITVVLRIVFASMIFMSPLIIIGIMQELWYYNAKIILTETELIFQDLFKRKIIINYKNIVKLKLYPSIFFGAFCRFWNCLIYYTQNNNLHIIKIPGYGIQEKEFLDFVKFIRNECNLVKHNIKDGLLLTPWTYWEEYFR